MKKLLAVLLMLPMLALAARGNWNKEYKANWVKKSQPLADTLNNKGYNGDKVVSCIVNRLEALYSESEINELDRSEVEGHKLGYNISLSCLCEIHPEGTFTDASTGKKYNSVCDAPKK